MAKNGDRKAGRLTGKLSARENVHHMIQSRAEDAGIETKISCHSFRTTGTTTYPRNGSKLKVAQAMAGHESARTTGVCDRRNDAIALDESSGWCIESATSRMALFTSNGWEYT